MNPFKIQQQSQEGEGEEEREKQEEKILRSLCFFAPLLWLPRGFLG